MTSARDATRNTGIIAIDPATTDAVGAVILALVDDDGRIRIQFQHGDLEHLPAPEVQAEIAPIIAAAFEIANTPGFTR